MNRLFQLVLFVCLIASARQALAQHEHWNWRTYSTNDGLPHSTATCVAEDSLGFIWVGTSNGLCRFDGVNFSTFQNVEGDTNSLCDNRVRTLTVSPNGNVLIATHAGLSMFDYATGKLYSHQFDNSQPSKEKDNIIRGFQCWPNGRSWVFTFSSVYEWDHATNIFEELDAGLRTTNNGAGPVTLPTADPMQCWMATENGVALVDYSTRTASRINPVGDVFSSENDPAVIENFSMDSHGKIWYVDIKHATFYHYDPKTNYQKGYRQEVVEYGRLSPVSTLFIYADLNDRLWVSSWSTQPYVLDTSNNAMRPFRTDKGNKVADPYAMICYFFESSNGDLWIAGSFGLRVHSVSMESMDTILLPIADGVIVPQDQEIHNVLEGHVPGQYFIGTTNGLFRYNPDKVNYSFFRCPQGDTQIGVYEMVWCNEEIICGTNKGVFVFNPLTENFRRLDLNEKKLQTESVRAMYCNGDQLWVATRSANLIHCNLSQNNVKVFGYTDNGPHSTARYFYDYMAADQMGNLWLASHYGYSVLNMSTETFRHVEPTEEQARKFGTNVYNMIVDKDGMIWYSSFFGMYKIDPATGAETLITKTVTDINKGIVPLLVDGEGTMWFSTSSTFLTCARGSTELQSFVLPKSFTNHYRYSKGVTMSNDVKVFVSNYEILLLDQSKIQTNLSVQPPLINWFVAGDSSIVNFYEPIHLEADLNYFTFYFASPSAVSQSSIEYQYKVIGINEDWIHAQSGRSATYNNLPGGEYAILVRARLTGSNWVEMPKPLKVNIALKFHETILFKVAIILVLFFLLAIILVWRRRTQFRISQEKAVASFIELSGELSFDELCKYLTTSFGNELRYGLVGLYLRDEENDFFLKSKHSEKKSDMSWPAKMTMGTVLPREDVSDFARGVLQRSKPSDWQLAPLINEGSVAGIVAVADHASAMARRGDHIAFEKIISLFTAALVNHQAEEEMKKKEEMLEHINSLLAESQLVSLRAQMNPHFVFNCLSSIQQCIVMKQYTEASTYLNKFSRLFRMVLHNSSRSLISLAEEINVLTLYLELEHMRFQEKFEYRIDVSDDLDVDEVMIPSMLLQPFVENALWHGLMHKEGDRRLDIRFYMRDEEVFICEIDDNGIGREKAAEIKKQKIQTKADESKGIKISVDRLNLISMQQGKHATVFFEDKKEDNGQASGTLIRFELSAFLN